MIVVHIGMPKAGSTTIQHFLRENYDSLRRLTIDYPMIGREHAKDGLKHGQIAKEVEGAERALKKNRRTLESGLAGDHPLMRTTVPTRRGERQAFGSLAQAVSTELGWNRDRGLYMTRAQAASCVSAYRSSIDPLNEHVSTKLPQPLPLEERNFVERPFLPDASRIDRHELRRFYDGCGERWEAR